MHLLIVLVLLVTDLFSQMISVGSVTSWILRPSFSPRKLSYLAIVSFGLGLLMKSIAPLYSRALPNPSSDSNVATQVQGV